MDNLLVDLYALDLDGKPNLPKLIGAGAPWVGVCLKATEGTYYPGGPRAEWFKHYWPLSLGLEANPNWMRGAYHYARIDENPETQVDWFLHLVESAGGFHLSDMLPVVDVESADNPVKPGAAKLQDWVGRFSAAMVKKANKKPLLYGNIYLAENGYRGLCGTAGIIVARYSNSLPSTIYNRLGLSLKDLAGWQYTGTEGPSYLPAGYPATSPLEPKTKVDITALQWPLNKLRGKE